MSGASVEQIRERLIEAYAALEGAVTGAAWERDRALVELLGSLLQDPEWRAALLEGDVDDGVRGLIPEAEGADPPGGEGVSAGSAEACTRPAVAERVDALFEGRLTPAEMEGLWKHLDTCPACRARYQERWEDELAEGRRKRLFRGLPWDAVSRGEGDGEQEQAQHEAAAASAEAPTGWRRHVTVPRVALMVAAVLAVVGVVGLLTLEPEGRLHRPGPPGAPVLDPDGALTVSLFRQDTTDRYEEPWRMVQGSVGAGERLMATLTWDRRGKAYATVVLVDAQGRRLWLLPRGGPRAGQVWSASIQGPIRAARLAGEIKVPDGAQRLVLYGILTHRPLRLAALTRLLKAARNAPDFLTRPPRLAIPGSLQARFALDVLR